MKQEGSSQARYFVSRLIPAHKDPPYEQVGNPILYSYEIVLCFSDCIPSILFFFKWLKCGIMTVLQEARFPQLRTLTPEQRMKLKSSFLDFDDPSFCEWMRSLKVVPPEPS